MKDYTLKEIKKLNLTEFETGYLRSYYGSEPQTIVFYDMEQEKLRKSLKNEKDILKD